MEWLKNILLKNIFNKKDLHVILVSGYYTEIPKGVEKTQVKLIDNPESLDFHKKMQEVYPEFKTPYMTIFKNGNFIVFSDRNTILGNLLTLELEQKKLLENLIDQVASCKAPVYGMDEKSIATIVECFDTNEEHFPVTMKKMQEKYNVITHEIDCGSDLKINPVTESYKIAGTTIIKKSNPFPIHKKYYPNNKKTFPINN